MRPHRSWSGWFILAAALGWIQVLFSPVVAQTPPEHIEAYVLIVKAQQAEQSGNFEAALDLYRQGKDLYLEVRRLYPSWQPEVVDYRIAHTQNQMERLRKQAGNEPAEPAPPVADAGETVDPPAGQDRDLETSLAQARDDIAALEMAVEEIEAERANLSEKVKVLEQDLAAARQQSVVAQEQLKGLAAEAGSRELAWTSEVARAAQALELARSENENARKTSEAMKSRLEEATRRNEELSRAAGELEAGLRDREAAWMNERKALLERQENLDDAARQLKALRSVQKDHDKLQAEHRDLTVQAAELSKAVEQMKEEARQAQAATSKERKGLESERRRLEAENRALKETVDSQQSELASARDLRTTLRRMEKENAELAREIDGLNRALERARKNDEIERLKAQNNVLLEELKAFRAHLSTAEQRNRELERENALFRQADSPP